MLAMILSSKTLSCMQTLLRVGKEGGKKVHSAMFWQNNVCSILSISMDSGEVNYASRGVWEIPMDILYFIFSPIFGIHRDCITFLNDLNLIETQGNDERADRKNSINVNCCKDYIFTLSLTHVVYSFPLQPAGIGCMKLDDNTDCLQTVWRTISLQDKFLHLKDIRLCIQTVLLGSQLRLNCHYLLCIAGLSLYVACISVETRLGCWQKKGVERLLFKTCLYLDYRNREPDPKVTTKELKTPLYSTLHHLYSPQQQVQYWSCGYILFF